MSGGNASAFTDQLVPALETESIRQTPRRSVSR